MLSSRSFCVENVSILQGAVSLAIFRDTLTAFALRKYLNQNQAVLRDNPLLVRASTTRSKISIGVRSCSSPFAKTGLLSVVVPLAPGTAEIRALPPRDGSGT